VDELKQAINRFIADTNGNPKPFVWIAVEGSLRAMAESTLLPAKLERVRS
jgi:hypothetical protein